ncbi:MAG: hypothetical protein CMH64_01540 [Nanoarchaeota archaeon]|nr:hypothetical protein [Nanoarchaeota archaeon]
MVITVEKKRINRLKLFTIFVTTTFIFVVGIFFGQSISQSQLGEIEELQQDLRTQTLSLELQYALANQNLCEIEDLDKLGNELYSLSDKLAFMEDSLGKLNKDVLSLKEYYSLLEVKHWLFLKGVKEECNKEMPVILYFYSNLGDCSGCERQGFVLTYLKRKSPELNIFSFDINLDSAVINDLKELYELENKELPVLIVNNNIYEGLKESDVLSELL